MGQFGLSMTFLGIKQLQMIIFTLKIHSHNYLSILCVLWTGRIIIRKRRGSRCKLFQDTVYPRHGPRVYYNKAEGLFRKKARAKGYGLITAVRSIMGGPD